MLMKLASRAHLKRRHYEQEHIPADVRYLLEQQRRTQNDRDKWESIYKILFPGEAVPNLCMCPCRSVTPCLLLLMLLVAFWSFALQSGSNAYVSRSSNMLQEPQISTPHVPPMVMNGFQPGYPGFYNDPYNGIPYHDAELDEASPNLWQFFWLPPN